jgi:N,N-dimethylformamidase
MGGNGFYWRCAACEDIPAAIEVRRGRTGTAIWQSDVGENYLAFMGELGGIYRELGRPPQQLAGVGFIAEGHDDAHFRISPKARAGRAAARGTPSHTVVLPRSAQHSIEPTQSVIEGLRYGYLC